MDFLRKTFATYRSVARLLQCLELLLNLFCEHFRLAVMAGTNVRYYQLCNGPSGYILCAAGLMLNLFREHLRLPLFVYLPLVMTGTNVRYYQFM